MLWWLRSCSICVGTRSVWEFGLAGAFQWCFGSFPSSCFFVSNGVCFQLKGYRKDVILLLLPSVPVSASTLQPHLSDSSCLFLRNQILAQSGFISYGSMWVTSKYQTQLILALFKVRLLVLWEWWKRAKLNMHFGGYCTSEQCIYFACGHNNLRFSPQTWIVKRFPLVTDFSPHGGLIWYMCHDRGGERWIWVSRVKVQEALKFPTHRHSSASGQERGQQFPPTGTAQPQGRGEGNISHPQAQLSLRTERKATFPFLHKLLFSK